MSNAGGIVGEFDALKRETDADILAMQVGDFYEFFGEDAETVGRELDLKVSKKGSAGTTHPMAGVPVDDLSPYLKALVERGYRVAVADQYETEDGHAREVTRVATPGTLLETTDADAQYLAAVVRTAPDRYGLAFADVTTGRFLVSSVAGPDADDAAFTELYRFAPVEVLPGPEIRNDEAFLDRLRERTDAAVSVHDPNAFAPGAATHALGEQFGEETIASLGLDTEHKSAVRAAGAILSYVEETGVGVLASMTRLSTYRSSDHVELDATTQRNLELAETMHGDRAGSLFDTLDHTVSSPGARLLKEWLGRPRRDLVLLDRRQACVEALAESALAREEIRDLLSDAYDLERLASRAASGSANARDLLAVRDTLAILPDLREVVESDPRLTDSPLPAILAEPDLSAANALRTYLTAALAEDPPGTTTQGGMLRRGYHDDLDGIIDRHEALLEYFDTLGDREKRRLSITHLQVGRNRTDGYYIQVGNSETGKVPAEYREIKSLKNSKRYTTDELDEKEREILRLEEERADLEYELFEALRDRVASRATVLQDVGRAFAKVDALASLATHAVENGWTRPTLVETGDLVIDQGRHPVVEQTTEFVPNDARFDADRRFVVVTGPNMSGKSTYMRQTALVVLLAQVGSFVPADHARIGLVDGIFTRVGALDELAQGRSTFMVEMQELSNILHSATEDSLVILDEVGRGTATYDGISIAWAATEYLHNEIKAKTLFATHYHELTTLAEHLPRVENVHVAADERDGDVTFLRTVREGPTDRSYGIHVADLAGVPKPVVHRARAVLEKLRDEQAIEAKGSSGPSGTQQVVFDVNTGEMRTEPVAGDGSGESSKGTSRLASEQEDREPGPPIDPETEVVLEELQELDINNVPPIELMAKVQKWKQQLEK